MSIFSDFNDNVITPAVDAYNNVNSATTTAALQQAAVNQANATTAAPSGFLGLGGVSNTNPMIMGIPRNNLIVLVVVAVVLWLVFKRK